MVGLGGVGSWTAEALARSGVARLVLIDFDHIAESNINRQVQALGTTVGRAKGQALRERIADIHPGCDVREVDDFVTPDNWPGLLDAPVDVLVDACDQPQAKTALAVWSLAERVPLVCVGAAGGKRQAQRVEVDDLAATTHDPLLASLRQRLRKLHGAPRHGPMGLRCVFSRESVAAPMRCRGLRQRRQSELPRLRLERDRHRDLRHGRRRRGDRVAAGQRAPSRQREVLLIMSGSADGSLAQSVEQRTFNPLVACSSHARPTT